MDAGIGPDHDLRPGTVARRCGPTTPTRATDRSPMARPNQSGNNPRVGGSRRSSGICRGSAGTPIPSSWRGGLAGGTRSLAGPIPARQPADDPAQHESRLRREGEIGGHADDDAERQAQHRSDRDRGSDAHTRESMRGVAARGTLPQSGPLVLSVGGSDKAGCLAGGQRRSAEQSRPLPVCAVRGVGGNASPDS